MTSNGIANRLAFDLRGGAVTERYSRKIECSIFHNLFLARVGDRRPGRHSQTTRRCRIRDDRRRHPLRLRIGRRRVHRRERRRLRRAAEEKGARDVTRRAARFTQCDLERALRATDAQRARSGEAWRVRIEMNGAIVLEPASRGQTGRRGRRLDYPR